MAVCEILRSNSRTREYVQEGEREGKSLTDAMGDGVLEGMQTFDYVLEQLINKGMLDKELGLSYATNRTNLALRLETQGSDVSDTGPVIAAKPAAPARPGAPKPAAPPRSELDDLIER
jgi:Tfp pilus assembly ATPase PilU